MSLRECVISRARYSATRAPTNVRARPDRRTYPDGVCWVAALNIDTSSFFAVFFQNKLGYAQSNTTRKPNLGDGDG